MLHTPITRLAIAAVLTLAAASASAVVVTRNYIISQAFLADLYSSTFDGALIPCSTPTPPDAQECTFFNGYLPAGRVIAITNTATGTGNLRVQMETASGEITQVNSMIINMSDQLLVISTPPSPSTITVTQGNAFPAANDVPFIEAGTGTLGRDLDGGGFGTLLGQGTADPDQAPAVGQAAIFQHADPGNSPDTPDFAVFSDIVDSCTGDAGKCGLIPFLTLDGVRYRLEGALTAGTPSTTNSSANMPMTLKAQTGNNSIYRVTFVAQLDTDNDGTPDATDTDDDNDGIVDTSDNCSLTTNNEAGTVPHTASVPKSQFDADGDGYGNWCDADINQTTTTTTTDYTLLRNVLTHFDDETAGTCSGLCVPGNIIKADLNGSGQVTTTDYTLLRNRLLTPPGPSGAHPPLP